MLGNDEFKFAIADFSAPPLLTLTRGSKDGLPRFERQWKSLLCADPCRSNDFHDSRPKGTVSRLPGIAALVGVTSSGFKGYFYLWAFRRCVLKRAGLPLLAALEVMSSSMSPRGARTVRLWTW